MLNAFSPFFISKVNFFMSNTLNSLTITAPDDWHIHLRDGDALSYTVPDAARNFERAIVMPNLVPPVLTATHALEYKQRIQSAIPKGKQFEPLMVLYLTDNTTPEDVDAAAKAGITAYKLYPAGATTNSDSGVTDVKKCYSALKAMQANNILLLIHGEVTDADIDIFDREAVFLSRTMNTLITDFPELRMVLEHITTEQAVKFVTAAPKNVGATITAHHLLFNRNHMLAGGIRPHYYCLPILKRDKHQQALLHAATSGNPSFFLGTDSAPHATCKKEAACGCAGSYTAYAALSLYAKAFDDAGALDKLENFASHFGPDFYNLPRNKTTITLKKHPFTVPSSLPYNEDTITPIMAGDTLEWTLCE